MSSPELGDDNSSGRSIREDDNGKFNIHGTENKPKLSTEIPDKVENRLGIYIDENFTAHQKDDGPDPEITPQMFTFTSEETSDYMSMSGTSNLAQDTTPKDAATNLPSDTTPTDSTADLSPYKPLSDTSTSNFALSESGQLQSAQPGDPPYDVINEDLLDKSPTRMTFPPPPVPNTPVPTRHLTKSESFACNKITLQPLRMVDATNPDKCPGYPSLEANRQLLLTGIPEKVSIKDISTTFKTEILTRSDDLEDIKFDRVHGEAVVSLKTSRAADNLLERMKGDEKLRLEGIEVNVSPYDQALVDPYKIFVLEPDKTIEDVLRYIKETFGLRSSRIIKGEDHKTALLCFDTDIQPDISQGHQAHLYKWICLPVERTKRVKVKGVTMETKPEDLEGYFNQLSNDGRIESTVYRNTSRDCIITFSTIEDAEKVIAKHVHSFNGADIEVTYYYPLLDGDEEYIVNIPESIKMLKMDEDICWYLQMSKQCRKDLEEIVVSHHGKIRWPGEEKGSLACMEVICNVDERDRKGVIKIKEWKENSAMSVSNICQHLSVQYSFFALEIERDLKSKIQSMKVENPDSFCVRFEKNRVIIAGETKKVDVLNETIQNMIDSMEKSLDAVDRPQTKVVKLARYKYDMYVRFHFDEQLKDVHSEVDYDQNIVLQGRKTNVDNAISKLKDIQRQFEGENIKDVGFRECCLLWNERTRNYVEQRIEESEVIAILKCSEQDGLWIYCRTTNEINIAVKILKTAIKSTRITLDKHDKEYLQKGKGGDYLNGLKKKHCGRILFQFQRDELYIVTLDVLHQEIIAKVKNLLDLHTFIEDVLVVDTGVFLYIFNNKKRDVKQIIQQCKKQLDVEIDIVDKETRKGFMVKGTKERCKLAFAQLHTLVGDIIRTDYKVNDKEFYAFLQSPNGLEKLKNIQLAEKCVIQLPIASDRKSLVSPEQNILTKFRIGTCEVKILQGDITEQDVDYIVNPTDPMLEHKRGLGRTLVDKGGFSVQKSCSEKRSCIKEFDSFVGDAGNLPFRGIIHVVLPKFSSESGSPEPDIAHAVTQCLVQAEKEKATSIAFPMVGTGRFGYPDDIIVACMIAEMKRYLLENGTSTFLKHISICDIKQDLTILFPEAVRREVLNTTEEDYFKRESLRNKLHDKVDGNPKRICRENVIGSITLQDTDVIVNSTNKDLNLKIGKLSKTIVNEGGEEIPAELTKNYPNGILPGVIAVTTGGKLKCKAIFHGVLEEWDQDQGHAETVMQHFISECLLTATKRNYESISFPVLGSGALQFPPDRVANIMSKQIDEFESEHPSSSLKTVRIVKVSSEETVQDKTNYLFQKMDKPSIASIIHHRYSKRMSNVYTVGSIAKCYSTKVGNVTLSIEQGDLTSTDSAVIVNSVPESLNLKSGIISKAILKAAGEVIETEAKEQLKTFKETQLVMTSSGRMISCQKIVHIKAKNSANGWKRVIVKCLAEIEKFSYSSVAFPALGTGGKNFSPVEMGRIMAEAISEYIHGDSYRGHLKDIKIVLFNSEMVEDFKKEVKVILETPNRKGRFFPQFFSRLLRKEEELDSTKMVIHIYTESQEGANNVVKILDDIHSKVNYSKISLYNV